MATTFVTPLMNLTLPVVGPSGELGPTWASDLNAAFEKIDSHDHASGNGVKITQAGINITGDLNLNTNNLIGTVSSRYISQGSSLAGSSDKSCVYVVGGDLYYNNSSGTAVQITSGSGINLTSVGSIGGDFSTSTASVTYTDATKLFLFKQSATATADIAGGSLFIYENIASAKYNKIQSATSLATDLTFTLPASLPGSTLPVSLSATGVLSSGQITTAQITDANITTAKIADANVTTVKILDANVTAAKIATGAVTQVKMGALGQQVSSSSGTYSSVTTSFADVTNLTVTITTTGRPVRLELISDGSQSEIVLNSSTDRATLQAKILRGASTVASYAFELQAATGTAGALETFLAPSVVSHVDVVAAGTYTYKVQAKKSSVNDSPSIDNVKLIAYEL